MNASSWRKAADLVAQVTPDNPQIQAAAMAELKQLESLPLSALSANDSGPPQVIYDSQQPLASSTPRATSTSTPETPTETYCQIIPGMSEHLYPTLVADGSLSMQVADNRDMLQNQITSEVDKYLQEAVERCEREVNYFDRWCVATNTPSQKQKANLVEQDEEKVLELIDQDTSEKGKTNAEHHIQCHKELETILEEEEVEDPSKIEKGVATMAKLTKVDNRQPMGKIKPTDKMVMIPSLFDGTKPATSKQHYERFNFYINFQTKSGHLTDPVGEAIDLFEHMLDKTA